MKQLLDTAAKLGLWLISTALSIYFFFLVRETNLILMQSLNWSYYTINAIDKFAMLFLGLIIIAFFLLIQHLYLKKSWIFFLPVTGIQLVLFALVQLLRLQLLNSILPIDYLIFTILLIISIGLFYLYKYLKQKAKNRTIIEH